MSLVVVARFLDLPQARTAVSALRSAGLRPILFDEVICTTRWSMMFAYGGCRVVVPTDELEDAVAILEYPQPDAEPEPPIEKIGAVWRIGAGLLGVGLLTPDLGWLVLGVRSRRHNLLETLMGVALTAIVVGVAAALCFEAETLAIGLLTPSIRHNAFYGP